MKKRLTNLLIALALFLTAALAVPLVRDTERAELDAAARGGAPGSFVTLSEGVTHYEATGPAGGQVVVLVHGFSVPSYIWDPTFRDLAEAGFRVVRYDLYGRGWSDRPDVDYTPELFDRQLTELLDSLRIAGPVDLIGLSMGGPVVARFAAGRPEQVRKVVLVDPVTRPRDPGRLGTPLVGEWITAVSLAPSLPEGQLGDFHRPERFPDWPDRYREQMRYDGFRRAILSTLRHFTPRDPMPLYQALGQGDTPVMLVWGEHDSTVPLETSRGLRDAIRPVFILVRDAGHIPHYERPEVVSPAIIGFLRRDPTEGEKGGS